MMLQNLYNKTISIQRLTDITNTEKEEYQEISNSIKCFIEPMDDSYNEDIPGSNGKNFTLFCDIISLKEGDRVIEGSNIYKVIGIRSYTLLNQVKHIEAVIREYKE